jgi:DNA-binding CsgD family transcriptional regulator
VSSPQRVGTSRPPSTWSAARDLRSSIELTTQEALGPDGYDAAFTAGNTLGTDEAVTYVRRARGARKRPSHGWDSLTPTELQVVCHITAGLTNRQIGQRMFISPGTVKAHLSHIFTNWELPHVPTWPPKPPSANWTHGTRPTPPIDNLAVPPVG